MGYVVIQGILSACVALGGGAVHRGIPAPRPGHPGNIFIKEEKVEVDLPDAAGWKLFDYEDKQLAVIAPGTIHANLGVLPVGFYRLRRASNYAAGWVSAAVLEPLKAPTPTTSPICIDAGMAWFYKGDQIASASSICALAGVNRVRDRMAWGEIETERGKFAPDTRYDFSLKTQSAAGLQVLTVNHTSPAWANPDTSRFPLDLRDAYRFYRQVAARWKGEVTAIEPWNEADIAGFGGQIGSEMAALQKASYLGLKAGNPDIIGCLNVWATHVRTQLQDFGENAAWPYFDTYNLHHYEPIEAYKGLYADHRAVSAGRPMWVTEAAIPVRWAGDPEANEPTDADLHVQSERIGKVYAAAINEGVEAAYYFMLGHYVEGLTQFGVVRRDLSPRPAFVALAAAGRLLADARPVGTINVPKGAHAYLFHTQTDGLSQAVIVAWSDNTPYSDVLDLPAKPVNLYDHLGRIKDATAAIALTSAPVYAVFPAAALSSFTVEPSPLKPRRLTAKASGVVIQIVLPKEQIALFQSAYRVASGTPTSAKLYVYNFGTATETGTLQSVISDGWRVSGIKSVSIAPMGRQELDIAITPRKIGAAGYARLQVAGDFGAAGKPTASVRLVLENKELASAQGAALDLSTDPKAYELMVPNGPQPTADSDSGGVTFEAAPSGDPWFYPRLKLSSKSPVPAGTLGLACTITLLEGDAQFKVIFDEVNGSSYVTDVLIPVVAGKPTKTVAIFAETAHGDGWSAPDPKGMIDPAAIVAVKIGCNAKIAGKIRFRVSDVRWVKR